jgi:hypothetical protein
VSLGYLQSAPATWYWLSSAYLGQTVNIQCTFLCLCPTGGEGTEARALAKPNIGSILKPEPYVEVGEENKIWGIYTKNNRSGHRLDVILGIPRPPRHDKTGSFSSCSTLLRKWLHNTSILEPLKARNSTENFNISWTTSQNPPKFFGFMYICI